jgi:DNA helicase-2/ATP-dependent DNA helicase PcrA
MQRIYATGRGEIDLEDGWRSITKPENFRCPVSVLTVANAIRRNGDGLVQTRGRIIKMGDIEQPVVGTARIFIMPADEYREERILAVRKWIAEQNGDPTWRPGAESQVKVLVIVHRMAANRLGFGNLYNALNDKAPDSFKNGFLDGTAWPVRPFFQFVLPLTSAIENNREFEVMTLLREYCPLLAKDDLPRNGISALLSTIRQATIQLAEMMKPGSHATNRELLEHLRTHQLLRLDPRIVTYLDDPAHSAVDASEVEDEEEATKEIGSMDRFLKCRSSEFIGYRDYVDEQSPFSTQQGIKGAEFDKVLIIADDEEGTHFQFSYDKYFGIKPLSDRDRENIDAGKETQVERTRRLFYVCCTRAMTDLAVVLFTADVQAGEGAVRAMNLFAPDQIFNGTVLAH